MKSGLGLSTRIAFVIVFALLSGSCSLHRASKKPLWDGVTEGINLYQAGKLPEALAMLTPAANAGNDYAQYFIARIYREAQPPIKNLEQSFILMKNLAKTMHFAKLDIGMYYRDGIGVDKDIQIAYQYLEDAIKIGGSGGAKAIVAIAELNKSGELGYVDIKKYDSNIYKAKKIIIKKKCSSLSAVILNNSADVGNRSGPEALKDFSDDIVPGNFLATELNLFNRRSLNRKKRSEERSKMLQEMTNNCERKNADIVCDWKKIATLDGDYDKHCEPVRQ